MLLSLRTTVGAATVPDITPSPASRNVSTAVALQLKLARPASTSLSWMGAAMFRGMLQ
jgi:hypothetical protein